MSTPCHGCDGVGHLKLDGHVTCQRCKGTKTDPAPQIETFGPADTKTKRR